MWVNNLTEWYNIDRLERASMVAHAMGNDLVRMMDSHDKAEEAKWKAKK